jgi:hypothetical protein
MGAPLPASPPITPLAKVLAFVQLANKNGDIKKPGLQLGPISGPAPRQMLSDYTTENHSTILYTFIISFETI